MKLLAAVLRRTETIAAWKLSAFIFVLAFALRVAGVLVTHQYRDLERFELERVALSVAQTGSFGNPYAIPTGPTAHVSPGYPLILAVIFRLWGAGIPAEVVKQIVASASSAFVCAMLPFAGRALQFPAAASLGAALFAALLPIKFRTETEGDWESPYAALALMLVLSLTVIAWHRGRFSARASAMAGVAWSIALLFVSALFPLLLALLVVGFFVAAQRRAAYLRYALIVCGCIFLCLSPWALRNWHSLGSPVFGRDNDGIELRVSNNPYAHASAEWNFEHGVHHRYHPFQSAAEAAKVREMGEIAFNKMALAEARSWITSHPYDFLLLSLNRARWYWFFGDRRYLPRAALLGLYTVLGFVGLVYLYRRDKLAFAAVLTALIVVPLPNYLVHVGPKHRYPIDWLLLLLAFLTVWQWLNSRRQFTRGEQ